jgi:hypothetical protein
MNKLINLKAILLIMLLVNSIGSWSQGNLQFSQVINLTPGTTYTVPANKVLKIESFTSQSLPIYTTTLQSQSCAPNNTCQCTWSAQSYLNIGSLSFSQQLSISSSIGGPCPATNSGIVTLPNIVFPIWLNAGKQISIQNITGVLLTAIEFNVVP